MGTAKTGLIDSYRIHLIGAKQFGIFAGIIVAICVIKLLKETSAPWMIFESVLGLVCFASMMTFIKIGMNAREVVECWDRVTKSADKLWLNKPVRSEKDKELRNMFESFRKMAEK